jgi:hypothetical protein
MLHMRRTLGIVAALLFATAANGQVLSPANTDQGRIAGHVVTAYAEIVADATVTLSRINDQGVPLPRQTMKTDVRGAFSFAGLPEGRYRVLASKAGYTSRQLPEPGDPAISFNVGPVVDLPADVQVLDVQVVLQRRASIVGRVIRPDGSAAANVQVQLALPGSGRGRQILFEARATSQVDGRYEIRDLPPGEYLVGALNVPMLTRQSVDAAQTTQEERNRAVAAARTANWSWYPGVPDAEPGDAVTLLEGVNAEGIDIWLTPPQRFSVSGVVFWPVGVAPLGITIDYGDPEGKRSGIWIVSDPGGSFALSGLAPGALTLLARAESDQGPLIGIATTEVTADAFEDVRILVDRPSLVAGRIAYEGNVAPSSRATSIVAEQKLLRVSPLYPVPESAIDSNGRFELAGAIGECEFKLDGLAPGLTIKRVTRNGKPLAMNRLGVATGETIRDIEIVVGQ